MDMNHKCRSPSEFLDHYLELGKAWSSKEKRDTFMDIVKSGADQHLEGIMMTCLFGHPELYFVSPPISALLQSAATALPMSASLLPQDFPSSKGFVWFANNIDVSESSSYLARAIGWHIIRRRASDELEPGSQYLIRGMSDPVAESEVIDWLELSGNQPAHIDVERDYVAVSIWQTFKKPSKEPSSGVLVPATVMMIPFSDSTLNMVKDRAKENPEAATAKIALVMAFLLFIQQRIFIPERALIDRPTKRRYTQATGSEVPVLKIIQLRKALPSYDGGHDSNPVDWSCQWLVKGHWRNQWYGTLNDHRPKWITAYKKGPDDKPFRVHKQSMNVVNR